MFREYTFDGQLQSLPTLFSMLNINDQRLFYAAHQRLFYAEHGLGASSIAQQLKIQEHGIYIVMRKSTTESTNI